MKPYYKKKQRNYGVIIGFAVLSAVVAYLLIQNPNFINASKEAGKSISQVNTVSNSLENYIDNATKGTDTQTIALQIHDLVNQQRASHGLQALQWSNSLAQIAQQHSNDMMKTGDYSHNGLETRLQQVNCISGNENIGVAKGYSLEQIPSITVNGWMGSYGHMQNVLGSFTSEGIGISSDGQTTLITDDFC